MKRILLTGISAVGKSTLVGELAARGYRAVDADCDEYSEWLAVGDDPHIPGTPVEPGRDWVWRADRMQALLSAEEGQLLFVSGCAPNMGPFLPQFDHVVLLSAPSDLIAERLRTRTTNSYGKRADQVARVLELKQQVEPLLRRAAGHEIDTSAPLEQAVAAVLQLAQTGR
jgi:shikimate kinase